MEENNIKEILESIGLNKNEVIVYLDLIKAGKSSVRNISKRTRIHRTNVYDTLEKLKKKSIIKEGLEENKKIFIPVNPKKLLSYLKQKEYSLQKIIPEIEKIHNKPKQQRNITMIEGISAFRAELNLLLDLNEPIFAYGIPKDAPDSLGGFIHDFHKRRISKKIEMKHIYNRAANKRVRELNKLDCTEARYLPSIFDSRITTLICGDKVMLIFWEDPVSTIIIENETIAKTYQNYFEIIWREAKINSSITFEYSENLV